MSSRGRDVVFRISIQKIVSIYTPRRDCTERVVITLLLSLRIQESSKDYSICVLINVDITVFNVI